MGLDHQKHLKDLYLSSLSENKKLKDKLTKLESELIELKKKVSFFEYHRSMANGIKGIINLAFDA